MSQPMTEDAPAAVSVKTRVRNPLSPSIYLLRNASKTIPLMGVILLAVMLIAGIVSLINSIPLSIKTIYSYSKQYAGVTPRGDASLTPQLKEIIEAESPVELERVMTVRGMDFEVRSIVGNWPFVVLALEQEDIAYYLERQGGGAIDGRTPEAGAAEAVISAPLARNLDLKIGDALLGPDTPEGYSPNPVKIVGIVDTDIWLALTSIEYHRTYHFPPIDALLVFADDVGAQPEFDAWLIDRFEGEQARVFTYQQLEEQADTMFSILYQILNVIIGTLVVVITLMMGMLMNIYLSQRVQEFGLLQALGYTRKRLLNRVMVETVLVVVGGWALGLAVAFGLLNLVKRILMDPNAFALDPLDSAAYTYTIPIPLAIFAVAVFTILLRFKKFDPVGVVERRLV